jgi:hypothetical protein
MRKLLVAIVAVGAIASVAMCALYGWDQAIELKSKVANAFIYGMIAVFSLALHGAAFKIFISGWRATGIGIGIAAFLAFVVTTFISLGGLASRADHVVAERQEALDTKDSTKRQISALEKERDGLKFKRATQAAVDAAKRAADTAKSNRDAECKKRGDNCRQREIDEQTAVNALTEAQANKDATDRFDQIEADLKRLRSQKSEGSVSAADPLKDLLAKIMKPQWADMLTSMQKVLFSVTYDICMVAAMIGIVVLDHVHTPLARPVAPSIKSDEPDITAAIPPVIDLTPAPEPPPAIKPQLPSRPRPKLASSTKQPLGAVLDFLHDAIKAGTRTEMAEAYIAYVAWCKSKSLRPMDVADFSDAMEKECQDCGIRISVDGDHQYLMGVQLLVQKAS